MRPESPPRRLLALLSAAQLVSWGSLYYAFSLFVIPLERDLDASRIEVASAFSIALLTMGVLGPPIGMAIDRGYARTVLVGGSVASAVAFVLLSRIESLLQLYLCWALLGACMACALYDATFTVLTRHFPGSYRQAITVVTFLGGLASTVFLPLTAWLVGLHGWRGAAIDLAALQLLICLPANAWALSMLPASESRTAGAQPGDRRNAARIATSAPFLLIALCVSLQMGTVAGLTVHLIPLLAEEGFSAYTAVAVASSVGIMQTSGRVLLFFFEGRLPRRAADLVAMSLLPLSLLLLVLSVQTPWLVAAFALLYGAGNGMMTIVKGTAIAEYVSRDHVGTLNGLIAVPHALARAAGPSALAVLWALTGGYVPILWLLVTVTSAAILALYGAQRISAPGGVREGEGPR